MYHKHFAKIPSTQIYLKDNLASLKSQNNDILISCSEQTQGIGRSGNNWETYPNSLTISFTLRPNETPSLTPLEIGLLTIEFIKKKLNKDLFLKWPNDLLTNESKKCGGIICQYIDHSTVIVGLGINLGKLESDTKNNFRHGLGNVDPNLELQSKEQETFSHELYQHLRTHRISSALELKNAFNRHCSHNDKKVSILDNGKEFIGIFKGIGENGEAIVEINGIPQTFLSSSLTILD